MSENNHVKNRRIAKNLIFVSKIFLVISFIMAIFIFPESLTIPHSQKFYLLSQINTLFMIVALALFIVGIEM